jgi:uncharacterized phage protein (TIGR02218 family)
MRTLPPSLAQKLDDGVTSIAMAWRLTRKDGVQVGMTQHDRDLSFDGTLFVAAHSFISGDHEKELNLAPDRTALSGALTVGAITQADLALGRWDNAKVEAFWVDWSNPTDFLPMWTGLVAGASWRGAAFELDIVGPQSVLDRDIGRVYARTCDAALGDGRCMVDLGLGGRTVSRVIATVLSDRSIGVAAPTGKAASDFIGGRFSLIAGAAQGWHCDITHIQPHASTWHVSLSRPFPIAPAQGDAVKITMGCDKSFATCKTRFANALNFRGQPTMPGDDVAFGGPSTAGNHGGKR